MVSSGKLSSIAHSRVTHSSSKSRARKKIKLGLKSRGTHSNSNTKIGSQGLWPSSKDVDVSTRSVEMWLNLQLVEIKQSVQSIISLMVPSIPGQSVCTLRDLVNATLAAINSCALLKLVQYDLELVLSHGTTTIRKGQYSFYTVNSTVDEWPALIKHRPPRNSLRRAAERLEVPMGHNADVTGTKEHLRAVSKVNLAHVQHDKCCCTLLPFIHSVLQAGVEEGQCKMNQFVATLTKYDSMTDLLARTPQLFMEEKIKSIDKYIKASPKAQIGGNKMTRGFHVGLHEFLFITYSRSDYSTEMFLKSATAHVPLHDNVDSLDDSSLKDDSLEDDLEDDAFEQWKGIAHNTGTHDER
ncbi:uncharacterized protein F5891DRAFT_985857 [Suillus fuscotomentosus]|uniref:Uncharacterized protein n=1 Tax=Suillus fuscotomentosus TaxID=1912939 RepID=A0AAD4DTL7_9AGAM|nr:uncharacterized protein F5891DRAFT_985857 [Suillus fuscotomentosus]KAG1893512.1 hypothetical protein F5891DRAFT_985857 [Suillus fuscotomentosus]